MRRPDQTMRHSALGTLIRRTLQKRRPPYIVTPLPRISARIVMVSSNLYGPPPRRSLHSHLHLAGKEKMDSVIDLSDAGKALDLARIRAQLM